MNTNEKTFKLCTQILTSQELTAEIREAACRLRDIVSGLCINVGEHIIPRDVYERIMGFLQEKRKIKAIKLFGEVTNLGLIDAKHLIETSFVFKELD